ncbi:hypothetical protein [Burkholderia ubonensis]|uniref:hypothetical protein n=1 Tax=Burkholderia ubonensis TaxID=101571 RepID=UPI0012F78486|nr:hypothetical protein [Burkholderia ubonensis]
MRDRDEPIKVRRRRTSRAREPWLAASGTSGPKYIARSVPARVAATEKICNALNGKGNFLLDVEATAFSVDGDIRKF